MRNTEQANAQGTNPEKFSNGSFGAVAVPVASYTLPSQQFGGRLTCSSRQRDPYSDFLCALALQRDRFHWNSRKLLTTRNLNGGRAGFFHLVAKIYQFNTSQIWPCQKRLPLHFHMTSSF